MAKVRQEFEIIYPLKHKVLRNLKIVTEYVGDLSVTGTAYCHTGVPKIEVDECYEIDIDFIKWNGTDIKPVLEVTGGMDEIMEYCVRQSSKLFEKEVVS